MDDHNKIAIPPLPALDDFYLYLETNNYSPKTLANYKNDLTLFENFLKSRHLLLKDLDKRAVFEFKAYLASSERETALTHEKTTLRLSSASMNRCLSAIRSYLRFLLDQDYQLPVAPDQFKMVKKNRTHPNIAELDDLQRLIEAPSALEHDPEISMRNRVMLEILFSTGMRVSELVSLNKRDINDTGRIFVTGKGRKQRFVYLTDRAQQILQQYLELRKDTQEALFIPQKGKTMNQSQRRMTTRYVQERIKKYREALKIDVPTSPHSLRHGFATYMAEKGASAAAIQTLLGHESLNTTSRYINTSDRFAQESHKKFHPLSEKKKLLS